ncbi:MAG: GyrI-like domain-containing protein [Planctomycetota bacterium]
MMTTVLSTLILAFWIVPQEQGDLPSAKTLLEKFVKASGGQYPKNLHTQGKVELAGMNMSGTIEERFSRDGRALSRYDLTGVGVMAEGSDGNLVWSKNPFEGIRIITGRERELLLRQYALQCGQSPTEVYSKVETVGKVELFGRPHYKLALVPKGEKPDAMYLDTETFLPSRVEMATTDPNTAVETVMTVDFKDWRKVENGDRLEPFECTIQLGPIRIEIAYSQYDYPDEHPEGSLEVPDDVLRQAKVESEPKKVGTMKGYEILEKELKEQATVTMRRKVKVEEISDALADIFGKVFGHAVSSGKIGGAPFCILHDMKEGRMDIEAGVPLNSPIEGLADIKASKLPAGKVLVTWHVGPYHELGKAHQALEAWMKQHDLESAAPPWEVYWTDPGQEPDPSKWRTEVVQPIR